MPSTVVDDVLAQLRGAVDAALALPLERCSGDAVAQLVEGLAVQSARIGAVRLAALAEAQERRVGGEAGLSTPAWFARTTRCRAREAEPTAALARALAGPLAPTSAALAGGSISVEHAGVVHRVMVRVDDALGSRLARRQRATAGEPVLGEEDLEVVRARAQAFLLEHATRLDPDQLAVAGRHLVHRLAGPAAGEAAAEAAERELERAGLTVVQLPDGAWWLQGTLPAVAGATVAAALDAASAPMPAGHDGSRDRRTARQRRAEALVQVADTYLDTLPGTTRTRPRVTVTVEARTLADPWVHGAAPGELTVPGCGDRYGGHPLAPATLETLACDADLVPVLVGADGAPLDVGRTVYAFPERVRTAIVARDRGCTFPHACGRPAEWCQVHHVVPFSRGGRTAERTGVLLCTPAHLTVHRHGWSARLEGDRVVWTPPRARRAAGSPVRELSQAPPWKPDLDRVVDDWRARLSWAPVERDTG